MEVDAATGRIDILETFQLTTSRGGRQYEESGLTFKEIFSTHDLSWRSTTPTIFWNTVEVFQLTTSRGGRRSVTGGVYTDKSFSTHDLSWRSTAVGIDCREGIVFSTHDLSWRSTMEELGYRNRGVFSTHDLSWRSTAAVFTADCEEFFQLTTSRGGRRQRDVLISQRRIFQLTTSRGGRLYPHKPSCLAYVFSTHDLSWRSTAKLHNKSLKFCIFSGHFILEQMSLPFSYKYH